MNRNEKISEMRRKLAFWTIPVVIGVTLPVHAQTSFVPPTEPPDPPIPTCPDEWSKSSFKIEDTVLCNHGSGPSLCEIRYEILIPIAGTRPPQFELEEEGTIEPLGINGCYDFYEHVIGLEQYCIIVYQDEGHPGIGRVKSCNSEEL